MKEFPTFCIMSWAPRKKGNDHNGYLNNEPVELLPHPPIQSRPCYLWFFFLFPRIKKEKDLIRSKIWQGLFRQLLKLFQKPTMRSLSRVGLQNWKVFFRTLTHYTKACLVSKVWSSFDQAQCRSVTFLKRVDYLCFMKISREQIAFS